MTANLLLILPLFIPLATLALCIIFAAYRRMQAAISLTGCLLLLASSIVLLGKVYHGEILTTGFGGWPAPFGIVFVADMFSAAMVVITGVMAVAAMLYHLGDGGGSKNSRMLFHPLYHGLLAGVSGSFLTGDLFNLYVWFEIMLISSFGLLVLQRTREQLDAGVKYAMLNLVVTSLLLMSVGFLYGTTGTLNMADLARTVPTVPNQGLISVLLILFLISFGAKAAAFPLFFWLPSAYPAASIPVLSLFAALLTKVGVYVLIRISTLIFADHSTLITVTVGVTAVLTMITGVLGAASHYDTRRILSFHIISQIGYMLIGIAVATPFAIAASILYIIHHIIVKANLFLIAGIIRLSGGSYDLKLVGGLYRSKPLLAGLFLIPAMSLAGIPPLSGFWVKFVTVQASLQAGHYLMATAALAVGLLTLYSMIKIWNEAFWKAAPESATSAEFTAGESGPAESLPAESVWERLPARRRWLMLAPVIGLAAITMTIGLYTEPFLDYSLRAGNQLTTPAVYIEAVLGNAEVKLASTGVDP